jgi:hypothetical protein
MSDAQKSVDSTETMHCKLGKQAFVDAVQDDQEDKCAPSSAHNLSLLERIARLREQLKGAIGEELYSVWSGDEEDDEKDDWDKRPP